MPYPHKLPFFLSVFYQKIRCLYESGFVVREVTSSLTAIGIKKLVCGCCHGTSFRMSEVFFGDFWSIEGWKSSVMAYFGQFKRKFYSRWSLNRMWSECSCIYFFWLTQHLSWMMFHCWSWARIDILAWQPCSFVPEPPALPSCVIGLIPFKRQAVSDFSLPVMFFGPVQAKHHLNVTIKITLAMF